MNNNSRQLDPLRQNIFKLARVRIASNFPVQIAANAALHGSQEHLPIMVQKLKKRRDLVTKDLMRSMMWNAPNQKVPSICSRK
jgi:aspartate/methionine/tyrosine aminotransferase